MQAEPERRSEASARGCGTTAAGRLPSERAVRGVRSLEVVVW